MLASNVAVRHVVALFRYTLDNFNTSSVEMYSNTQKLFDLLARIKFHKTR